MRVDRFYSLARVFLEFMVFAFIGFVAETVYMFSLTGTYVPRGLAGFGMPVVTVYGYGALLVVYALGRYRKSPFKIYVYGVFWLSLLELAGSYLEEFFIGHRSWDYYSRLFNLDGRICLSNSLLWGLVALVTMYALHPGILKVLMRLPRFVVIALAGVLFVGLVVSMFVKFLAYQ